MTDAPALEPLARRAAGGERAALEQLLGALRDPVYGLAIRMLWHPEDAEDATQEILVKVLTGLGGYRGEASVRTWAYRIASNHLLTTRKRRLERPQLGFDEFGDDLRAGLDTPYDAGGVDDALLAEEVKIGCTQAMLLCLDRDHRLAYILGEVFELESAEAADVLEITPAAYRKRLQRARDRIQQFVQATCGLAAPTNACRCSRRVGRAIQLGRLDPARPLFATHARDRRLERPLREMEALHSAATILRSNPAYRAPGTITGWITDLIASERLTITSQGAAGDGSPGPDTRG